MEKPHTSKPEKANQPRITVKAVIWRNSERGLEFLLLALNQKEAEAEGRLGEWHPAGGVKDDPSESDIHAALRETHEETGIPAEYIKVGEAVHEDSWGGYYEGIPDQRFEARFYSCEYIGPTDFSLQLSREHDFANWFTAEEFPEGTTPEFRRAATEVERLAQNG